MCIRDRITIALVFPIKLYSTNAEYTSPDSKEKLDQPVRLLFSLIWADQAYVKPIEFPDCFINCTCLAIFSGYQISSASIGATNSPRECSIPKFLAAATPALDWDNKVMRWSFLIKELTISFVLSLEPSSITIISKFLYIWDITEFNVSAINSSPL